MTDWSAIATAISDAGGGQVDPNTSRAVGGGCINRAYRNHLNLFGTGGEDAARVTGTGTLSALPWTIRFSSN